jgi:myo-inositol-1(or 4)-monophosphatase
VIVTAAQLRDVLEAATVECHRIDRLTRDVAYKADGSPVTAVDLGIDRCLRGQLASLQPGAAWLSEESGNGSGAEGEWTWVVDPLDGTKEYARRLPECAISIGLVEGERIRAGGVMNPMNGMGAAAGTDGSWIQWPVVEAPLAGRRDDLRQATASVSRSEIADGSAQPYLDLVGEVRPIGSVANKLMRTACGVDELTFSVQPKSIWDICGGIALLEARGMTLGRLDGLPNHFNRAQTRVPEGFVAGPAVLVDAMLRALRARMPAVRKSS